VITNLVDLMTLALIYLQMKCEFKDGDICERCKGSNHECVVPGRKPRPPQK
jgi:hypothetical protein